MNINGGPSATGLLHMAARAQEARKQFSLPTDAAATDNGKKVTADGQNLPQSSNIPTQNPGHATGLERAIERLQLNAVKNPDATGLQHALEVLQSNLLAKTAAEPDEAEPEVTTPGADAASENVTDPVIDADATETGNTEAEV